MWCQYILMLTGLVLVTANPLTRQVGLSQDVGIELRNDTEESVDAAVSSQSGPSTPDEEVIQVEQETELNPEVSHTEDLPSISQDTPQVEALPEASIAVEGTQSEQILEPSIAVEPVQEQAEVTQISEVSTAEDKPNIPQETSQVDVLPEASIVAEGTQSEQTLDTAEPSIAEEQIPADALPESSIAVKDTQSEGQTQAEQQTELIPEASLAEEATELNPEPSHFEQPLDNVVQKQTQDITEISVPVEQQTVYPEASIAQEDNEAIQSGVIHDILPEAATAEEQVEITLAEETDTETQPPVLVEAAVEAETQGPVEAAEAETQVPVEALETETQDPTQQASEVVVNSKAQIEAAEEQTQASIEAAEADTETPVEAQSGAEVQSLDKPKDTFASGHLDNSQFQAHFDGFNYNTEQGSVNIGDLDSPQIIETSEYQATADKLESPVEAIVQNNPPADQQVEGIVEELDTLSEKNNELITGVIEAQNEEAIEPVETATEIVIEAAESQTESVIEAAESQTETVIEAAESQTEIVIEAAESQTEAEIEAAESQTETVIEAAESQTEAEIEAAESQTETVIEAAESQTEAETEAVESFTAFAEAAEAEPDFGGLTELTEAAEAQQTEVENNAEEEVTESLLTFQESSSSIQEPVGSVKVKINGHDFVDISETLDAQEEEVADTETVVTEATNAVHPSKDGEKETDEVYWESMNNNAEPDQQEQSENVQAQESDLVEQELEKVAAKYGLKTSKPVAQVDPQELQASENEQVEFKELRKVRGFADRVARYVNYFF